MMSAFTPVTGLLGGSVIGLSAVALLLWNGDIMGCSGILVTSVLDPITTLQNVKYRWKFQFLSSFILSVYVITSIVMDDNDNTVSGTQRIVVLSPSSSSTIGYIIGGLCVGLGTKLANGCTSGHGVCGLGRLSVRSLASVVTFLLTGIATATYIASPHTPWSSSTAFLRVTNETATTVSTNSLLKSIVLALSTGMAILSIAQNSNLIRSSSLSDSANSASTSTTSAVSDQAHQNKMYGAIISGALFAIGLGISGMTQTDKVKNFLDINPLFRDNVNLSLYDPTLLTVLGAAVPISAIGYIWQRYYMKKSQSTYCGADWSCIPNRTDIDTKLIGGSVLFGIGWGLVGLCPGPALWSVAAGVTPIILYWFPSFSFGSYVAKRFMENTSKTTYSPIPGSS